MTLFNISNEMEINIITILSMQITQYVKKYIDNSYIVAIRKAAMTDTSLLGNKGCFVLKLL